MSGSAEPLPDPSPGDSTELLARLSPPAMRPIVPGGVPLPPVLPFIGAPAPRVRPRSTLRDPAKKKAEPRILRGLKDLQELQKQTVAVLEAVQGSLDDIQQVLRSPEATRGLEKQKNAATLLAKGFPREAVEQAAGTAHLLPANPEAHLLLALSLAADEQFDASLAATRKGLALIDRRNHSLAIEAGLLHALSSLGCVAEAVERWAAIIDSLPLPVLLEQSGRIAACFPPPSSLAAADPSARVGGTEQLDFLLAARLRPKDHDLVADVSAKDKETVASRRGRLIDTAPEEIPPSALFAGLDAAEQFHLPLAHRAVLVQIAQRLKSQRTTADLLKFVTECLVPLGNRGLERATASLSRTVVKRLYHLDADAPTLYRAMEKFQMAGDAYATREVAKLLEQWRKAGRTITFLRHTLFAAAGAFLAGLAILLFTLLAHAAGTSAAPLWTAAALLGLGILAALAALVVPARRILLPHNRPPLAPAELHFLHEPAVRHALRGALHATRGISSRSNPAPATAAEPRP